MAASSAGQSERERIVSFLNGQSTERLVELIVEQMGKDWTFREQVLLEIDRITDAPIDLDAWTRRIEDSMFVDDYVDWRHADAWASGVNLVLEAMSDQIANGNAGAMLPLVEHAFRTVERSVGYVDDSNNGCLRDISERIGELHYRACEMHRPDPVALARTLIDLELNSELEGLYHAVNVYADLLGDDGLAEYGRLLETMGTGHDRTDRGYAVASMHRAYITALNDVDPTAPRRRRARP